MEQFALSAKHSGAINHQHSFHFNGSVIDVLKEVRLGVTVVVTGWVVVTAIRQLQTYLTAYPKPSSGSDSGDPHSTDSN